MRALRFVFLVVLLQCSSIAQTILNGAGATFPNPMYQAWSSEYHRAHPDVQLNYQSIGSAGGIRALTAGALDFAATDWPMSDEQVNQLRQRRGIEVIHVPTVMGAVVLVYNLPEVDTQLKFSGAVLGQMYLGNITRWNDPAIAKENPGVILPDKKIIVVHRTDGSSTTYIFRDFLARTSPEWKEKAGSDSSVRWPVGVGAWSGGGGERAYTLDGAIFYTEWIYAVQNHMTIAGVRNAAGKYINASPESIAEASVQMPQDFRAWITNTSGDRAYPMACLTWLLIPRTWGDPNKRKAMINFLDWILDSGQKMTSNLHYVPLPETLAAQVRNDVKQIK